MGIVRAIVAQNAHALAAGARVDADHRPRVVRTGWGLMVTGQLVNRDLEHNRMDVVATHTVDAFGGVQRDEMELIKRTQPAQIEYRSQIDEERIITLASKDL